MVSPSASPSSISKRWAGISSQDSRQTTCTSRAPVRTASRATSMASRMAAPGPPPPPPHDPPLAQVHLEAQVDVEEELHGAEHAVQFRPLDGEPAPLVAPDGQEDRRVALGPQVRQREVPADGG